MLMLITARALLTLQTGVFFMMAMHVELYSSLLCVIILVMVHSMIGLDNVLVPVPCIRHLGCSPRGKQAAILRRYPTFCLPPPLCAVFSCFHTAGCEAYSFYDRWIRGL